MFVNAPIFSQETMEIELWAVFEPEPSFEYNLAKNEKTGQYAFRQIRDFAPFVATGIFFGWNFSYTPSDALRKVDEFFELTPMGNYPAEVIQYEKARVEDERLVCTVLLPVPEGFSARKKVWESTAFQKLSGVGRGRYIDGIEGMESAYKEALKNSIREHQRAAIKNKPKEIKGSVILRSTPTMHIEDGNYVVNAEFFLRVNSVVQYTVF
jgi:hypothetical protein